MITIEELLCYGEISNPNFILSGFGKRNGHVHSGCSLSQMCYSTLLLYCSVCHIDSRSSRAYVLRMQSRGALKAQQYYSSKIQCALHLPICSVSSCMFSNRYDDLGSHMFTTRLTFYQGSFTFDFALHLSPKALNSLLQLLASKHR